MDKLRQALLDWYHCSQRKLPWRETSDPYRIWVSEIMLQQTRVAAALPYYERFLSRYPDVKSLAEAPAQEVLAAWSGLGYYSRVRNLYNAAQQIAARGGFPRDYASIRRLPGVGDYTAAAIASIAFGLPYAVLDGNVMRVLARLTNESGEIQSVATRRRLQAFADELLDRRDPGRFNQALMELGATLCLPQQPQCQVCPLAGECEAHRQGRQNEVPVKARRNETERVERTLLLIWRDDCVLMRKRPAEAGRLADFWELPEAGQVPGARMGREIGRFRHSIVNQEYMFTVMEARARRAGKGWEWVRLKTLHEIPVSTVAKKALRLGGVGVSGPGV